MNNDSNAQLDIIAGVGQGDDSQQGNLVRMHAALVGNVLKKALRARPPETTNHGQSLIALADGVTPQPFRARHPRPRSIIIRNFCNVPAQLWEGSTPQGPSDYIVPALSWMCFPVDAAVEVYTCQALALGGIFSTNGGVCYVDLTDQVLSPATGSFATNSTSTVSATGAAAAAVNATIPAGTDGRTNYLTSFSVSAGTVVAAVNGTVTVTGVIGGPLTYQFTETVAGGGDLNISFPSGLAATGPNVAITVTVSAITGGSAVSVNVTGYRQ